MKSIIVLSYSILFCLGFVSFGQNEGLKIGDKAPHLDMPLQATTGVVYDLAHYANSKGLLVVFSCNTCPFVVGMKEGFPGWEKEYNAINELAKAHGVGMVLVNSNEAKRPGEDSMEEMVRRAALMNYQMPYVLDLDSKLANAFGAITTPHVYLFNENFELIYMGSIDNTWDPKRKKDIPYLINAFNQMAEAIVIKESEPRGCSIKRVSQK